MKTLQCIQCGINFAIDTNVATAWEAMGAGKLFYCPNGHAMHYVGHTGRTVQSFLQEINELQTKVADYIKKLEEAEAIIEQLKA